MIWKFEMHWKFASAGNRESPLDKSSLFDVSGMDKSPR